MSSVSRVNHKGDVLTVMRFKLELGIFRYFDDFLTELRRKVRDGEIAPLEASRLWEKVKYPCYQCSRRNVGKLLEA